MKISKVKADFAALTKPWKQGAPEKAFHDRVCRNIIEDIKAEKAKIPIAQKQVSLARVTLNKANGRLTELILIREVKRMKVARLLQELKFRIQVIKKADLDKEKLRFRLKKLGLAQEDLFLND